MRSEMRAPLVDGAAGGQAEYLIAAAVGQDRARPPREPVQSPSPCDQIVAGPEIEMVGVAQQNFGAGVFQITMGHALHGALSTDRHEGRRFDRAMRRTDDAAACAAVAIDNLKTKRHVLS